LARFEPATFGSSGKHTNHYTTKVTVAHYFEENGMPQISILIMILLALAISELVK
jgi:hypothetical protein